MRNIKLKRLVADLSLDKAMLQDVLQKILKPVKKREMVNYLTGRYTVGLRQACRCVRMTRSMYYYRSRMGPQTALRQRMREIAHTRVRFCYCRVYIMLRREGWDVGKDRFYRVYREENLGLRRKRPWRHVSAVHRLERQPALRANEVWGMDFVADQLADGRKIRTLTIVDLFTREWLGIEVGFRLRADHVVAAMDRLKHDRGLPQRITTDNAIVESFNGWFREEFLNVHWFESIDDASENIDAWRWDYNENRPHRTLMGLTPAEFAVKQALMGVANSQT